MVDGESSSPQGDLRIVAIPGPMYIIAHEVEPIDVRFKVDHVKPFEIPVAARQSQ